MKMKDLFEGPTVFEWFLIACVVLATMQVARNQASVLAKAKAEVQLNK
jgi:hypothetical protein